MKKIVLIPFISLLLLGAGTRHPDMEERIRDIITSQYEEAQLHDVDVPGVVVGYWDYKSKVFLIHELGVAEKQTEESLTADHSFKIASVTKTMVATVMAQLVDEGKIHFNSPLSLYYPALPGAEQVSIRMLGDMTSGYFDYLEDEGFLDSFDNKPYFAATPDQLIATAMKNGTVHLPGKGFLYSNTNTVILGQIIEKITGNALEKELQARLFVPLNMTETGAPASGSYLPEPKAHSYHPKTKEDWTNKMDYSPEYACGNAYSTLHDLKIWVESLAKGSLIKQGTYAALFENGTPFPNAPGYMYYFGIIDYKGFLGHSGETDYYLTEAYHNPDRNTTIVILSNTSASGFTSLLFQKIVELTTPDEPAL